MKLTRAQKAATVLVALGPEAASRVMSHMSELESEQLALEVAQLGQVPGDAVNEVLREFIDEAVAHQYLLAGGIEYARDVLRRTHGVNEGDAILERLLASVVSTPFSFLRSRDPEQLIQHLAEEHPQTVALIVAHLPPGNAGKVMGGLDENMRQEVALRVATMDTASPEVIEQVEAALHARIGGISNRDDNAKRGGVKELASILNNSDRGTERSILAGLETRDPELAEQVRSLMFVFEDITGLDDRAVQEILREVDSTTLALAMKGVRDDVRDKILNNVSQRAAEALREELEVLGAVRVRDVEAAQSEIVRHIRQLEEEGKIIIKRGEEADVIE